MIYDKPITIETKDDETEDWHELFRLHARVNKTGGGTTLNAGADQFLATLTFEIRYFKELEDLRYSPQLYRIIYRGHSFRVTDYDDFMEQHRTVKLVGEHYE